MKNIVKVAPVCAFALLLAACGGGSGSGSTTQPPAYAASVQQVTRAQVPASAADYTNLLQHVYVAYFGRPADPSGLDFYAQRFLALGAPTSVAGLDMAYQTNPALRELIDAFGSSPESQRLYQGADDDAFISAIYRNLFNREAEAAGKAFWGGAIRRGELTRTRAALAIMDGAQGDDIASVASKAAAAATFTSLLNTALRANSYVGDQASAAARTLLAQVGPSTDLFDFASRIEAAIGALVAKLDTAGIYWFAGALPVAGGLPEAGINDGIGTRARFGHLSYAGAFATDASGNLYVADRDNHFMRKVTPAGSVTNIAGYPGKPGTADGDGATTPFTSPAGIATDGAETYYIGGNMTIRKVAPDGTVSTIAGAPGVTGSADGAGATARFGQLNKLVLDAAGNVIAADQQAGVLALRRITPAGVVTTVARINTSADGLAIDGAGNLYVPDYTNSVILKVTPAGAVSTFAGASGERGATDGTGAAARFNGPGGIAIDPSGNLYVIDTDSGLLRQITPAGVVSTLAGTAGVYGAADYSALPGSLPQARAIAFTGPKTLVLGADTGLVKVILP